MTTENFNELTGFSAVEQDAQAPASPRDDTSYRLAQDATDPVPIDVGGPEANEAPQELPETVTPDDGNVVRLPAGVSLDDVRVDGDNLVLAQPDGTLITVVGGALSIPTFLVGDVEIGPEVLVAALEAAGINVAAGPDGTFSVAGSSPNSSGANFDLLNAGIGDAGPPIDLLPPTELTFGQIEEVELYDGFVDDDPEIVSILGFDRVDEDGLPGANADAAPLRAGEVDGGGLSRVSARVVVDFGDDAPGDIGTAFSFSDPDALSGQLTAINGAPIVFTVEGGALVGRAAGVVDPLVRIELAGAATGPGADQVTYEVQLMLLGPVRHGASGEDSLTLAGIAFEIADGSGDVVGDALNIDIYDDVPRIGGADVTLPPLTVDESDLATDAMASFAGLFTTDGGADGTASIVYALGISGPGADSGLVDTLSGAAVLLKLDGAAVVGYAVIGGVDTEVFRITVAADGTVTLDQSRSVVHPDTTDHDEPTSPLASTLVTLTATITDGDSDTAQVTANIGGAFIFKDDGPTQPLPETAVLPNGAGSVYTFDLDFDLALGNNYGADGPGTVRFPASLAGPSGLTSNGVPITYTVSPDGSVLTAMAGVAVVFTATLLPGTATYTIDMDGKVDSVTRVDFSTGGYNFVGGNADWQGFTNVADNSSDLLLTAGAGTINTNANAGGVNNPFVDLGEVFRVDFVTDLVQVSNNGPFTFERHYSTNGAAAKFTAADNATVTIYARDDFGDGTDFGADLSIGNGTIDTITQIAISWGTESKVINVTTTSTLHTVGGRDYYVRLNGDGSVTVDGVYGTGGGTPVGTTIAVFTANGYSSLEFHGGGDDLNGVTFDNFQIGNFGAAVPSSDPVHLGLPIEIVDGDGDTANTQISVTLTPEGQGIQDWSAAGGGVRYASQAEPHMIGSDNPDSFVGNELANVLMGGGGNDTLGGMGGNDILVGGPGDDILLGGAGNDILIGGAGNDDLSGDAGDDVFVFSETGAANVDDIYDFVLGDDAIDLSGLFDAGAAPGSAGHDLVIDRVDSASTTVTFNGEQVAVLNGNYAVGGIVKILIDGVEHDVLIQDVP